MELINIYRDIHKDTKLCKSTLKSIFLQPTIWETVEESEPILITTTVHFTTATMTEILLDCCTCLTNQLQEMHPNLHNLNL